MKTKALFLTLSLSLVCLLPVCASAEVIPGTSFSIHFESGNMVGSGRNINMHRVPVVNIDTGQTTLFDVAFRFTFAPGTGFIFEEISSAAVSPPVSVTNITPGLYISQLNGCFMLEGPSLLSANRSLYTIRSVNASGCGNRNNFTAQIVSGTAAGHPDIGSRDIVPSLADTYVYGFVADSGRPSSVPVTWQLNALIGVRQSGDQLILGLFSDEVDDFRDPLDTVILTKIVE